MNIKLDNMRPEEKATITLSGLYEKFGYKKYKISRFEEYSLYLKYKSFLTGDKIITFTDLDGKLLALKPDVTLSIIKNSKADSENTEKAYYTETVYRESKESNTFREISQMGLEYLGKVDSYAVSEAVYLARQSLEAISENFILELGCMDFATALVNDITADSELRESLLKSLAAKSGHEIYETARTAGICGKDADELALLCGLNGSFTPTLEKARAICRNEKMSAALDELAMVYSAAAEGENDEHIRLDFTLLNDDEYYSGIIMAGYIEGLPRKVLAGGRYDKMMRKFKRTAGAVGFAVYLNELERMPVNKQPYDIDVIIYKKDGCDSARLLKQVKRLTRENLRVMICTEKSALKAKQVYEFTAEGGLKEC